LNGGTRRHIVFSTENRCVATLCDYRGGAWLPYLKNTLSKQSDRTDVDFSKSLSVGSIDI
jgi:hypothetical protein